MRRLGLGQKDLRMRKKKNAEGRVEVDVDKNSMVGAMVIAWVVKETGEYHANQRGLD